MTHMDEQINNINNIPKQFYYGAKVEKEIKLASANNIPWVLRKDLKWI